MADTIDASSKGPPGIRRIGINYPPGPLAKQESIRSKEEDEIFTKPSTSSGGSITLETVGKKESRDEMAIDLSLADPATKMLYFARKSEWSAVLDQLNQTARPDFSQTDQVRRGSLGNLLSAGASKISYRILPSGVLLCLVPGNSF